MATFEGLLTAMVTPFAADGSVDLAASRRVARHLIENGSDGIVVAGTTGESPTLDDSEKIVLLSAVLEEAGDGFPVVCGTGSNDTAHSVVLSRAAADAGAGGVLVVCRYYNKPNRRGLLAHFGTVAGSVECPVILYNIPSRAVINMPPDLLAELAEIENVVAVKQANDEEIQQIPGLDLLAGNDDSYLRCLEAGGTGGILVASHLVGPRMRAIYDSVVAGELDAARSEDEALRPLYTALGVTTNPIPIKAALDSIGLCSDRTRLPMVPASDEERQEIETALSTLGIQRAGA
ncbi:MAG: 4-hydroxy-tetrahydrodipicolinate synthase [bacterium]